MTTNRMTIQSIQVNNFKVLKDVFFKDLKPMNVLIGANGSGKTTFLEALNFIKDIIQTGFPTAIMQRGGFQTLISSGTSAPIEFRLVMTYSSITYLETHFVIEPDIHLSQVFYYISLNQKQQDRIEIANKEPHKFESLLSAVNKITRKRTRAEHLKIIHILTEFTKFFETALLSNFIANQARNIPPISLQPHLSLQAENLAQVVLYLQEEHPESFKEIEQELCRLIPGLNGFQAMKTIDKRIVLGFKDKSFSDPFFKASDGTLKLLAYLTILYNPDPLHLIAIEEPENHLYPLQLMEIAETFRVYGRLKGQVFVTTHSPDFLNACKLEEIYFLENQSGYTRIIRPADDLQVLAFSEEGDLPGQLWKQELLKGLSF